MFLEPQNPIAVFESVKKELDHFAIAARYRYFAALCRERAQRAYFVEHAAILQRQADQWERDAQLVIDDAKAVISSRCLLEHVSVSASPPGTISRSMGSPANSKERPDV